jgi:uncharacterized protein with PIN domain
MKNVDANALFAEITAKHGGIDNFDMIQLAIARKLAALLSSDDVDARTAGDIASLQAMLPTEKRWDLKRLDDRDLHLLERLAAKATGTDPPKKSLHQVLMEKARVDARAKIEGVTVCRVCQRRLSKQQAKAARAALAAKAATTSPPTPAPVAVPAIAPVAAENVLQNVVPMKAPSIHREDSA